MDNKKKVYVNRRPVTGPWGGGNKTLSGIVDYLSDIGSHGKPELTNLVSQTIRFSNFVIFPSDWARRAIQFKGKNYSIIENAPLSDFFENRSKNNIQDGKLKIVTHHWSNNKMKGFDIYEKLGDYCLKNSSVEFTYIGRYSEEFSKNGINVVEPKDVNFLKKELPKNHVYLTASMYEAGANHVLEGMAAGLPVVYRSSGGSINEYCSKYGIEFENFDDLIESIDNIRKNYYHFREKVATFSSNFDIKIKSYGDIILS